MAYIGKTPSQATRSRFYYTATGGETSLSGADDNGNTLVFSDGNYVDVMLNGVTLVADTDYNTTTANTIGGLTALTADDVVEIVVYDTFSVFGGDVKGDFTITNGTFTSRGIDDNASSTAMTLESNGDIDLGDKFKVETSNTFGRMYVRRAGVTNISSMYIQGADKATESSASLSLINNSGSTSAIELQGDGSIVFSPGSTNQIEMNLDGNIVLPNGAGIDFSATGNGTGGNDISELFDDYEHGRFTASITATSGGSITVDSSMNQLQYTKIGNMVYVSGLINVSAVSSPTGQARITGMPFAMADLNEGADRIVGSLYLVNSTQNIQDVSIYPTDASGFNSSGVLLGITSGTGFSVNTASIFSGDENVGISFFYRAS